ncbi:MAG: ADP-ribosylglycohydrolase family protein [Corynebacterium sp.]|uniref:ADP-ribosylglycohydrolase family protein n=1 Tax=Corynebacterium sp. TaxID=1720 RepID=UPI0026DD7185|nr:ADP-ribosylglycohydrolase family protein [Corynebacterium sp.]MDO4761168.1 ADP-ribosylglycohydrolase family protein [Corynebacterium sp.]
MNTTAQTAHNATSTDTDTNAATQDRCVGALVGLAVGDALGAPVEFMHRDRFPAITGMTGGGKFNLPAGTWTDDTSMALCIARSLIETSTFDLANQLDRYLAWRDEGYLSSTGRCFGIGQQTLRALGDYHHNRTIDRNPHKNWRSGNGSLMRLAPVAMAYHPNLGETARTCAASSITTHPARDCIEACAAYGVLIAGAIHGWDKNTLLTTAHHLATHVHTSELATILRGSYATKPRAEISSSGYVLHTLEAALWAFAHTNTFEEGACAAANLGDDADTVTAVYGQLAGAHYGAHTIPTSWTHQLHNHQLISTTAHELSQLAGKIPVATSSKEHCGHINWDLNQLPPTTH